MRTVLDEASALGLLGSLISDAVRKGTRIPEKASPNYIGGSISKYAKDLIMTFPTLIDNSLTPETASMISKAHERNVVSMLQILFASMQITGRDGREIINRIYGNKNGLGSPTYDDYMDALNNFYHNNTHMISGSGLSTKFFESGNITNDVMVDTVRNMQNKLKQPMKSFPLDSFSNNSLNDYSVMNINGIEKIQFTPVKEANGSAFGNGWEQDKYGFFHRDPHKISLPIEDELKTHNQAQNYYYQVKNMDHNRRQDAANYKLNKDKFEYQKGQDDIRNTLTQNQFDQRTRMDLAQISQMRNQVRKDNIDALSRQLLDSDIKKSNEMQPTLIIINYSEVDANDDYKITDQRSFVAGVKSRLIPVTSTDILERIVAKNKTRINFLNFIRATTGEINFIKDFILCMKQTKIDAKNYIKRGQAAEMWKTLEALATKNNRNKLRKSGNDASAITTLVVNQETVNLIYKEYEIDLENINTARQVMNDYNLLALIIADESIEVIKFLYDGNDMFEQQAYSFLEKENNDKAYKKIINLMGQNRRF